MNPDTEHRIGKLATRQHGGVRRAQPIDADLARMLGSREREAVVAQALGRADA